MRHLLVALLVIAPSLSASALDPALAAQIRTEAARLQPELVQCRRWFHQRPELSNRETGTAAEIARRLRAIGLEPHTGVAGTGVVAVLEGALPGPVRAWRTDIDALPIEEAVDVPWRSKNPGVMHACGHDLHLTVALGTAELLTGMRNRLHGTVVFIFQPAEEGPPPGEPGGAPLMIEQGVLDHPHPEAIFALHVAPSLTTGTVGWRAGGLMASADRVTIHVIGKASHGSAPHEGIDAVWVGSQLVGALQGIAAREIDARLPVVVTIGTFDAGSRFNIVAGSAELTGTVRTLDEPSHDDAETAIRRIVDGVCTAHRATCTVDYERMNPVLVNDEALAARSVVALSEVLGKDAVVQTEPIMAAEDFAWYARRVPGFYFHLGVAPPGTTALGGVHTPTFTPDENAIRVGVEAASAVLLGAVSRQVGRARPGARRGSLGEARWRSLPGTH